MQLGEAVIEVLAHRVRPFMRSAGTFHIGADLVLARPFLEIGARTKPAPNSGYHNHPDVRIIIGGPHILADLGDGTIVLRRAVKGVHLFWAVELNPEDTVIFFFVEQIVDELRSHGGPPGFILR